MEIGFDRQSQAALFNDTARLRRKYGPERARKIELRLAQIDAAQNLQQLCSLPQARCHQLTADRCEQFSLDLDGPYRLIVEVADEPVPRLLDGGIDRCHVTRLWVVEVTDTH
ncbi:MULTISPECIES: type II toxin-antitoxin system RelE/ParE family toxin [Rhodococcus]|uniref:type II toxin-antitoxin system RelE/ParE family toxin n=1 Tax=Rhodococcus TaxID=1827 RepID=UPI000C9D17FD|nr:MULTISPECIES: type II toxin-antitoxin system RelE/ParE family toxin [Rhodococcus]PND53869.1 killer suppression protein [Rhodococcus sp. ENV425]WKX01769.1 type II toxin-antitoxin system RelE/ParE family toxin [Rhodococcus aetherivorans]